MRQGKTRFRIWTTDNTKWHVEELVNTSPCKVRWYTIPKSPFKSKFEAQKIIAKMKQQRMRGEVTIFNTYPFLTFKTKNQIKSKL